MRRAFALTIACGIAGIASCSNPHKQITETAKGEVSAAHVVPSSGSISYMQISGRWEIRATPETGDTTPTTFVLTATSSPAGWTITFPGREPIPTRVLLVAGDSFAIEIGPYSSARRPGVQTITRDVFHLRGDELAGTGISRYRTSAPDSIVPFRLTGGHAP